MKKAFTIENLKRDRACEPVLEFANTIIEQGGDVAVALRDAGHYDFLSWAIRNGYDCESARTQWLTWDEDGRLHATAGRYGTATVSIHGTATAGNEGRASAGVGGIIHIAYHDSERKRLKTGYIGEDGLKPNTLYRLNDTHEFVEVTA